MTDQSARQYAAQLLNRAGAVFDHEDVLLVASIIPLVESDLIGTLWTAPPDEASETILAGAWRSAAHVSQPEGIPS